MRIEYIDSLKGFGILLVIIGHISPGGIINSIIYSFHMAIFFLLSGIVCNNDISIKEFLYKKTKTILLPFITFTLIHSFFYRIPYLDIFKDNVKDGLWFLFVLYFTQNISFLIYKISKSRLLYFIIFNSAVISILIFLKLTISDGISNYLSLSYLATNYIFYIIGNIMNMYKKSYLYIHEIKYHFYTEDLVEFLSIFITFIVWTFSFYYNKSNEISNIILRFSTIIFLFISFRKINGARILIFFKFIGKYTLAIYLLHSFFY